jgi:hypothetical protein
VGVSGLLVSGVTFTADRGNSAFVSGAVAGPTGALALRSAEVELGRPAISDGGTARQMLSGFFVPERTGSYVFDLEANDQAALWFETSGSGLTSGSTFEELHVGGAIRERGAHGLLRALSAVGKDKAQQPNVVIRHARPQVILGQVCIGKGLPQCRNGGRVRNEKFIYVFLLPCEAKLLEGCTRWRARPIVRSDGFRHGTRNGFGLSDGRGGQNGGLEDRLILGQSDDALVHGISGDRLWLSGCRWRGLGRR